MKRKSRGWGFWKRLYWRLWSWRTWLRHRTWDRYYVVKARTLADEPRYYDPDYRLLHVCFELLVQHLEECATAMFEVSHRVVRQNPWFIRQYFLKEFESTELPEEQKELLREKRDLYFWWTDKYPQRDSWMCKDYWKKGQYYQEEDEMLKRLITIRSSLWN